MRYYKSLVKFNWTVIPIIFILMIASLLSISSTDPGGAVKGIFTSKALIQLRHFILGWIIFFICAFFDYNRLKSWAVPLYVLMILSLLGVFFVPAIQNVHRWYRIPLVGLSLQPSEYAKLILVIVLSWFLECSATNVSSLKTAALSLLLVFFPFVLILKEPDLGTALVLCPISLTIFYLGNVNKGIVRILSISGVLGLTFILCIFLGFASHEKLKPTVSKVLKEYQYERLNPENHHQWASVTAISIGGFVGKGWRSGSFTGHGWLPYGQTDSIFSAIGEEFGFIGLLGILSLFYYLIYFGCQTTAVAKNYFGKLLSAGLTVYIIMHVLINVGMMCALLPITGVPLVLLSYGGSSILATMTALGLLQSIYSHRYC